MTRPAADLAVALMLVALAASASARTGDRNQPIEIAAETGSVLMLDDGEQILEGDVRIDQGTLAIRADRATVTMRGGEMTRVVLEGAPATLQQEADDGALTRAAAHNIDYAVNGDTVVLTGNVVVTQPRGELRGERVTYDLTTERLRGGEPGSGAPIRMVIQPRQSPADDTPAAGDREDAD